MKISMLFTLAKSMNHANIQTKKDDDNSPIYIFLQSQLF